MNELIAFVKALDPNLGLSTVFAALAIFGLPKVWRWFTDVYFPARQRLEEMRLAGEQEQDRNTSATLATIRDAMVELKTGMLLISKKLLIDKEQS